MLGVECWEGGVAGVWFCAAGGGGECVAGLHESILKNCLSSGCAHPYGPLRALDECAECLETVVASGSQGEPFRKEAWPTVRWLHGRSAQITHDAHKGDTSLVVRGSGIVSSGFGVADGYARSPLPKSEGQQDASQDPSLRSMRDAPVAAIIQSPTGSVGLLMRFT